MRFDLSILAVDNGFARNRFFLPAELQFIQLAILRAFAQELFVRTIMRHFAVFQQEYFFGGGDGGKFMGDDERRLAAREPVDGRIDLRFGARIQTRHRFVENH